MQSEYLPENTNTLIQRDMCTTIFITELFTKAMIERKQKAYEGIVKEDANVQWNKTNLCKKKKKEM